MGRKVSPWFSALAVPFFTRVLLETRNPVSSSSPGSTCACAPQLAPYSPLPVPFPFPSPLLLALGEGEVRRGEPEQGLSQCPGGPRARPPPSLPHGPIGIYYNVVASRGGRGAGGPRAAPASSCGGKAGGRAPGLLARSLARLLARSLAPSLPRSLPPLAGLVS